MNVLLQILDDGEITDSHGRKVNFENTVIVMTSNAGSERKEGTVGFGHTVNEQNRDRAMKALGEFLRPEFLNRVERSSASTALTRRTSPASPTSCSMSCKRALRTRACTLRGTRMLRTTSSRSPTPRPTARAICAATIQKELEDVMAAQIIDSYEHPVTQIHASMEDGKLVVRSL